MSFSLEDEYIPLEPRGRIASGPLALATAVLENALASYARRQRRPANRKLRAAWKEEWQEALVWLTDLESDDVMSLRGVCSTIELYSGMPVDPELVARHFQDGGKARRVRISGVMYRTIVQERRSRPRSERKKKGQASDGTPGPRFDRPAPGEDPHPGTTPAPCIDSVR